LNLRRSVKSMSIQELERENGIGLTTHPFPAYLSGKIEDERDLDVLYLAWFHIQRLFGPRIGSDLGFQSCRPRVTRRFICLLKKERVFSLNKPTRREVKCTTGWSENCHGLSPRTYQTLLSKRNIGVGKIGRLTLF
jgi:hypothetical protein